MLYVNNDYNQKKLDKLQKAAEKKTKRLEKRIELMKLKAQKPTKKALHTRLWKLTSELVRTKGTHCFTCDKQLIYTDRQAGHFWTSGGHSATRYDLRNLRTQCAGCNMWKSGFTQEYAWRLEQEIGKKEYDALRELAHTTWKWSREDLETLIEERKKMLEES